MDRANHPGDRTDDLSWVLQPRQHNPACWFCRRPNVTGTVPFGASGTRIPCCPAGTGCKDGRIHHGPPDFGVHWPDEPCATCARSAAGRRIASNRGRRPGTGSSNSSTRHR